MKPGDFFVGVIDFFSTLVPGAIATYLLITLPRPGFPPPAWWPSIERGSTEGWVVFLVSAYVLGHLITAVGSSFLDRLYDRVYARWRRANSKFVKTQRPLGTPFWVILADRVDHVLNKSNPDDELLATAKALKRQQLKGIAQVAGLKSDDITNTYWWAGTVVRLKSPAGATEVDALSAQSKLFRSIIVLLLVLGLWASSITTTEVEGRFWSGAFLGWMAVLALSLWRFLRLRWDATERTYEHFIAATVLATEAGPAPDKSLKLTNGLLW